MKSSPTLPLIIHQATIMCMLWHFQNAMFISCCRKIRLCIEYERYLILLIGDYENVRMERRKTMDFVLPDFTYACMFTKNIPTRKLMMLSFFFTCLKYGPYYTDQHNQPLALTPVLLQFHWRLMVHGLSLPRNDAICRCSDLWVQMPWES